jgi:hypothetical protein
MSDLHKPLSWARKSMSRPFCYACALRVMQHRVARVFLAGAKMGLEEAEWLGLAALGLLIALILALALTVSASVL